MTSKTTFRKCKDIKVASELAMAKKTVLYYNQKAHCFCGLIWDSIKICEKASCTITLSGEHLLK